MSDSKPKPRRSAGHDARRRADRLLASIATEQCKHGRWLSWWCYPCVVDECGGDRAKIIERIDQRLREKGLVP